jgi:pimeloyl-ACP methyl ester carboxylesterase
VILLHGLFSSAQVNWIKYGTARRLAEAGFTCLLPDLRAHGQSAAPMGPRPIRPTFSRATWPRWWRNRGSSISIWSAFRSARAAARSVIGGLAPRRLVLAGMGLEGLAGWKGRLDFFRDVIDRFGTIRPGDPAYLSQQFLKGSGVDRVAVRQLLGAMEDTSPAALAAITMPTLVLCGDQDNDNGSADNLAAALPNARRATIRAPT